MDIPKEALAVVGKLRACGCKAYLCGGCVRDFLLGRVPKDYDIVSDAPPQKLRTIFSRTVEVGAKFGVVQILWGNSSFEVAAFRKDGNYSDGRRPDSVVFSDEKEDALRRDFTINGLFLDPETGEIRDYVGGRQDLQGRIIRTIGAPQDRFREDYLRLLRAVRFSCALDFAVDPKTWESMADLAHCIERISAERIREELFKMLSGPSPARALNLLKESGLLRHILPELERVRKPGRSLKEVALFLEKGAPFPNEEFPLAAILLSLDGEDARNVCSRLKLPTRLARKLLEWVEEFATFESVFRMRAADLKKFLRRPFFAEFLEFYRIWCEVDGASPESYLFCRRKALEWRDALHPSPFLTGEDLRGLGIAPGPIYRQILEFLEDRQLEGEIFLPEQALSLVKENFGQHLPERKE